MKKIHEKMVDYRQFSIVLLAIGSFLYFGLIIPSTNIADSYLGWYQLTFTVFLASSLFFLFLSHKCQKKLQESEEEHEDYL